MVRTVRLIALFVGALIVLSAAVAGLITAAGALEASHQLRGLDAEAEKLAARPFAREAGKPVIVVTGSSTVRLWRSSARTFPEAQVVNTGFGGSTMEALGRHAEGLILRYEPDQVFIGSGDNDLAAGYSPQQIISDTQALLDRIAAQSPGTVVAIIAAKPSLKRWYLRDRYEDLNTSFAALALQRPQVEFVDVWHRLVDADGQVRPELYDADGLHLNARGYRVYAAALRAAQPVAEHPAALR